MGVAAYNRGTRAISEAIDREIRAAENSKMARAALWQELLTRGYILFFKAADGSVITAGPDRQAVAPPLPRFALYRYGDSRWSGKYEGGARDIALQIVEHAGRARPYLVVEPGSLA